MPQAAHIFRVAGIIRTSPIIFTFQHTCYVEYRMSHHIHTLANQYFQLVDVPDLVIPSNDVLIQPAVQEALYEHMFNESLTPLPPATYRSRVLKLLLSRIEDAITDPEEDVRFQQQFILKTFTSSTYAYAHANIHQEILDTLMEAWGNLLTTPKPSALEQAQQLSAIKYTAPTPPTATNTASSSTPPRTVTITESRGVILSGGTTGNRTWEAALHLGSYLSTPSGESLIRGKRVIELGAGTGFLSLFCAKHLGADSVVATDREQFLIDNMRNCINLNQHEEGVSSSIPMYPAIWDWGTKLELESESEAKKFDIALGADLIYDSDIIPLLIRTVQDLFENYGISQFIIAATLRNEKTFRGFLDACREFTCLPVCMMQKRGREERLTIALHRREKFLQC